jgi:glycerophosphoryl diester phosphodiesterase
MFSLGVLLMIIGPTPQVIAHRGASGYAPETTLASYRIALQMKVDYLELDLQMTADGELVAIHDTLVDRTTNGKGAVGEKTLAELKALDAGSWFNRLFADKARTEYVGEKIRTLQEIIDLTKPTSAGLYIELKSPELYPADFEARLLSILKRNQFEQRVVVQSFNAHSVEKMKSLDAGVRTAFLVKNLSIDPVEASLKVRANELAISYELLTTDIVKRARANGLAVTVWTVDEVDAMKRMIDLGVDRIITNYPDRLQRILSQRK